MLNNLVTFFDNAHLHKYLIIKYHLSIFHTKLSTHFHKLENLPMSGFLKIITLLSLRLITEYLNYKTDCN